MHTLKEEFVIRSMTTAYGYKLSCLYASKLFFTKQHAENSLLHTHKVCRLINIILDAPLCSK